MERTEENEQITLTVDNLECLKLLKGVSKSALSRFIREYIDGSDDSFWNALEDAELVVNNIIQHSAENEKERLQAVNLLCNVRYLE